jgi:hypothetical protein
MIKSVVPNRAAHRQGKSSNRQPTTNAYSHIGRRRLLVSRGKRRRDGGLRETPRVIRKMNSTCDWNHICQPTFEPSALNRQAGMSDDFDSLLLDASEKAAVKAALNRCRVLAGQIESKLRDKTPEHFIDEFSLTDFYASLERAADVLGQKRRRPAYKTRAPAVNGPQPRGRQRHR